MARFPRPAPTFPAVSAGRVSCASRSGVPMQTVNSAVTPDRGNGTALQQAYRAAAAGKPRANNTAAFAAAYRLIFAAVTLSVAAISGSASFAQSGPFTGMDGVWSGGGTVTLDDGSTERIRCRATYAVGNGGNGLNQSLTCASDSYRFNLSSNVVARGGSLSGTWNESSRNISGEIEGSGGNGNFQVTASAPGFNANLTIRTTGNRQSVTIRSESAFRAASISLNRS